MSKLLSREDLELFFPRYLNPESKDAINDELEKFNSLDFGLFYWDSYHSKLQKHWCQGDGVKDLAILPSRRKGNAMLITNTCDMDVRNENLFPPSVTCAPVIQCTKIKSLLQKRGIPKVKIDGFFEAVKSQQKTTFMYLPPKRGLKESIVFLDRAFPCKRSDIGETPVGRRLFSLRNSSFYLFLFKISVHFCRIQEKIDRS